jgi:hypothetical protein
MKTAGATFRRHLYGNFGPGEVYPDRRLDKDLTIANVRIDYLTGLSDERHARTRAYSGHFPFMTVTLIGSRPVTITILRDPIERTISYLKHCRRYHPKYQALSLEAIYEIPFFYRSFIHNHQSKLFALSPADRPLSFMHPFEVDERRLETAKANLERVDIVGLQEQFDLLLAEMHDRFGWTIRQRPDRHVSGEAMPIDPSFRRRIADDNAADVAFYEHARRLHADAHRSRA